MPKIDLIYKTIWNQFIYNIFNKLITHCFFFKLYGASTMVNTHYKYT